ncbi:MAG TPA: GNAT family N-acetyltransferase [Myxococcota bacterium]|nr:GNAT family N-acetyltransferase [Myxococcota bacterium]
MERETSATPLRLAAAADVATVLAFMAPFNAEMGVPFDAAIGERLVSAFVADPSLGRLWLIERDGCSLGYVALTFGWSFEYRGRDGIVDELYVAPTARRRGLARAALEALLAEADALGLCAVHLEVERESGPAERLYRSIGFAGNDRQLLTRRLRQASRP